MRLVARGFSRVVARVGLDPLCLSGAEGETLCPLYPKRLKLFPVSGRVDVACLEQPMTHMRARSLDQFLGAAIVGNRYERIWDIVFPSAGISPARISGGSLPDNVEQSKKFLAVGLFSHNN